MSSDEFTSLARSVEQVQKIVNRIDDDLSEDRKDIDKLLIRLGHIEELLEKFIDLSDRQTKKVKQTVEDAVEKQIEPVADKVSQINEIVGGEN